VGTDSILRYDGASGTYLDEFVAPGSGGLEKPNDLVFDANGDLLVLSAPNDKVIRYSGSDGSFDTVLIDGTGGLDRPKNATYLENSDELLISSARSNEILKYDASTGDFLGTFVSAADGGLDNPKWQLLTESGDLLVISQLGDQILKYSATGDFQEVLYSVPASQASTTILMAMTWGTDGSLLVAEDNDLHAGRVIRLDADSGAFLSEYVRIGSGGLDSPRGIMTDGDGNLYVASYNTDEILRYSPESSAGFTVSLSAASDQPVTVDYTTGDGSATAGYDHDATSGTLLFAPGETSQSISVPIFDDAVPEATESFTVNLSNASGALLADSEGLGQIIDDGDPANLPPISDDDGYSFAEDSILSVATPGVFDGDSDPEGDSLTATLIANASHGAVTLNTDGSFVYTPNPDFSGSDSFTYVANDGTSDSNVATVSIDVSAVNDAPVATADAYSLDQDTTLSIVAPGLLGNDSDVDGDSITASLITTTGNGSLSLASDGSFDYTPDAGFFGSDSFSYQVGDSMIGGNTVTVSLTVNAVASGPNLSHGEVTSVASSWQTVNLPTSYTSMVVIATPRYNSGSGPGVARVRNATGNSFEVCIDDVGSTSFNGGIHYVVVEEGVYDESGFKLEAVKYTESQTSRKRGWVIDTASQGYQQSYSNPVVVGHVMSANDPDWSVFWASSGSRTSPPSSDALNVGKHVAEDTDTARASETIGYLVIEATQSGTISLSIDEDQLGDSERKHTTEQVAYFVIDPPVGGSSQGNEAPQFAFPLAGASSGAKVDSIQRNRSTTAISESPTKLVSRAYSPEIGKRQSRIALIDTALSERDNDWSASEVTDLLVSSLISRTSFGSR
jgi:VCBS repeat-containing protein